MSPARAPGCRALRTVRHPRHDGFGARLQILRPSVLATSTAISPASGVLHHRRGGVGPHSMPACSVLRSSGHGTRQPVGTAVRHPGGDPAPPRSNRAQAGSNPRQGSAHPRPGFRQRSKPADTSSRPRDVCRARPGANRQAPGFRASSAGGGLRARAALHDAGTASSRRSPATQSGRRAAGSTPGAEPTARAGTASSRGARRNRFVTWRAQEPLHHGALLPQRRRGRRRDRLPRRRSAPCSTCAPLQHLRAVAARARRCSTCAPLQHVRAVAARAGRRAGRGSPSRQAARCAGKPPREPQGPLGGSPGVWGATARPGPRP